MFGVQLTRYSASLSSLLVSLGGLLIHEVGGHGYAPALVSQVDPQSSGDFRRLDVSSHSFLDVDLTLSDIGNPVRCASECVKHSACRGFYYNRNSNLCYISPGQTLTQSNDSFNQPGVVMYKSGNPLPCPTNGGFKEFLINSKNYCFFVEPSKLSYLDARQNCQDKAADLFHFDDEPEKLNRLEEIVAMWGGSHRQLWIGLHSPQDDSNVWYWDHTNRRVTAAEHLTFSWIGSPEPRVACAKARVGSLILDDDPCTFTERSICEVTLS